MHILPELDFDYLALEPHIDAKTMKIHHSKHHQGYVDKLNAALEKYPDLQSKSVEDLLKEILQVPDNIRTAVVNNGGGHANHSFFWTILTSSYIEPNEKVVTSLSARFGSVDKFKEEFGASAATRFGSGWAWLVKNSADELEVYSTPNQDSPLMEGKTPILGLDVWEHAYYLNYQNRRLDYIEAFWKVVNWQQVSELI